MRPRPRPNGHLEHTMNKKARYVNKRIKIHVDDVLMRGFGSDTKASRRHLTGRTVPFRSLLPFGSAFTLEPSSRHLKVI